MSALPRLSSAARRGDGAWALAFSPPDGAAELKHWLSVVPAGKVEQRGNVGSEIGQRGECVGEEILYCSSVLPTRVREAAKHLLAQAAGGGESSNMISPDPG